jgi:hypothetical protein
MNFGEKIAATYLRLNVFSYAQFTVLVEGQASPNHIDILALTDNGAAVAITSEHVAPFKQRIFVLAAWVISLAQNF